MKISAFFYSFRQGLKNIGRNKIFTLASIATMVCCIFMFSVFYAMVANLNYIVKDAEEGVAILVYFDEGLPEDNVASIGDEIRTYEGIGQMDYISSEQAWLDFQAEYFADDPELASGFENDNPLASSNHYEIYMEDIEKQDDLVAQIEAIEGVERVDSNKMVADVLSNFNKVLSYFSVGIVGLLFAVAVFLISNTVAVGISVRKNEIAIMKLIGATDFFVRAPFIIEGVVLGLIGSVLPMGLVYVLYNKIVEIVADRFGMLSGLLTFIPVNEIFEVLVPAGLLIGIGIGFLGSILTIRKHLRV